MFSYVSAMCALSFSYGSPMLLLFSFLLRKAMRTEDNHWISIVFAWSGLVSSVFPWCSEFRLIFIRVPILLRVMFWFFSDVSNDCSFRLGFPRSRFSSVLGV